MNLNLTPENSKFLRDQVESGQFASGDAAVNLAIELLKRQTALRVKIQRSIGQLDRGEYIELDDEGLDEYFAELMAIAAGGPSE